MHFDKSEFKSGENRKKDEIFNRSIEELENDFWGEPEFESGLVIGCHNARKKKIKDLTIDEIRMLIGQKIGVEFLIPIAIKRIEEYSCFMMDFFEICQLMKALTRLSDEEWKENKIEQSSFVGELIEMQDEMEHLNRNWEDYKECLNKYKSDTYKLLEFIEKKNKE